jgi:hypothetical protein
MRAETSIEAGINNGRRAPKSRPQNRFAVARA